MHEGTASRRGRAAPGRRSPADPVPPGRSADTTSEGPDLDALEQTLLGQLGLGSDTTPEQIQATHDAVVAFLTAAPRSVRGWARKQAAAADEAYVLLSDPVALARSAALAGHPAPSGPGRGAPAAMPAPPAAPARPSRANRATVHKKESAQDLPEVDPSDDELDELIAQVTPSAHRDELRPPPSPTPRKAIPHARVSRRIARPLIAVATLSAAAVIGLVVYQSGQLPPVAAGVSSPAASAAPSLDEAQVVSLMAKVQANPKDTESLMALGDAFFQSGQYQVAADWLAKLVAIDASNVRGLLALGAADFNAGNAADAERYWKQVVALDAKNVEAHYDLGFLYLQQQPSDYAGVQREWQRVVELAPGTEVAQSVQAHLSALASQIPSPSAGPSGTAAPSAAGASPSGSARP